MANGHLLKQNGVSTLTVAALAGTRMARYGEVIQFPFSSHGLRPALKKDVYCAALNHKEGEKLSGEK